MLNKEDKVRYLRLIAYLKPLKAMAALAVIGTLLYGMTEPLMPWVMKGLIDEGFSGDGQSHNYRAIYYFVALMIGGFTLRGIANYASSYATTWVGQKVVYQLRSEMFAKMQHLPMAYFNEHSQGSMLSKFTYDVNQLLSATTNSLIQLIRDSITILALIISLFVLDWQLTLILMIAAPFVAWFIVFVSKKMRHLSHRLQEDMGSINHVIDEALRGRTIVRIFNGFTHERARFNQQAHSIESHILASSRISAMTSPILEVIIILALSAVILIAATQSHSDGMTNGKFVAFLGSMALLFPPIKRLGKVNEAIQRGLAAMESVFALLDAEEEEIRQTNPSGIRLEQGDIRFENVSFAYGERQVLEDFSLHIRAGESIALVGESGSGKSTLAALLAGFYPPDSGRIFIDGQDTAAISLKERRQAMAYVSQETMLFDTTIAQNIAYADEKPDQEKIVAAAVSANADEFIRQLPQGYDSPVGQYGNRLSGGQKQRIAIARALYKDAPILILDEATSALDNRSEQKVQEAIERLSRNRTAIIIAHRLSTIENADRIVVLERGKIIESGSHQALLDKNGYYAKLLQRIPS